MSAVNKWEILIDKINVLKILLVHAEESRDRIQSELDDKSKTLGHWGRLLDALESENKALNIALREIELKCNRLEAKQKTSKGGK